MDGKTVTEIMLTPKQAEAIAEIGADHEDHALVVRGHRTYEYDNFVEVVLKKDYKVARAFIVDRQGGYYRLPIRERRERS